MAYQYIIRVIYPLTAGRIVLRTDTDWGKDVEATSVSEDRTVFTFKRRSSRPYFYFKPCIVDGDRFTWSQGNNYLASLDALDGLDIYPYFYAAPRGSITDRIDVPSDRPGGTHHVRVYRPPGYQENTLKRYPVLYMHDGTNLFFPEESFLGVDWDVDSTLDLLDAMNVIDKVIVVGIYANDREAEYTKTGYEPYGRFIVESLVPWMAAHHRVLAQPEWTAVMGSSLGGVVSMYLAWQYPQVFGMAGCMSSTFGWKDDLMPRIAREPRPKLRLYLDSGWPGDNYEVTRSMRDLLLRRGFVSGQDLLYLVYPHDLHNEQYWATRVHIPFQFFFGKVPKFPVE
jgi:predicted alpha/beta superfamily hydrolase